LSNRQVNIDYSISQALKRFPQNVQALIIYDICCQWIIHFQEHILESEFLNLYDCMEITGAVGKWHLAAHIPECFSKFTLNFMQGAAQVDGEILETLWSDLDEVAGLAQAMSISNHQETVDDHMNDSNWQKIVRIGKRLSYSCTILLISCLDDALCGKWDRAKEGTSDTRQAFDQLSNCLDPSLIEEWMRQEQVAMEKRGDHLKVYKVESEKCR